MSIKYAHANNSHSDFCEVTPQLELSNIEQPHGRRPNCQTTRVLVQIAHT